MANPEEETNESCGCWILLLVIGGGWYFFQDDEPDPYPPYRPPVRVERREPIQPRRVVFTEPEQALPQSGVMSRNYTEGLAPFEVVTRAGSGHYYVKFVKAGEKRAVATMFVRGGSRAEIQLPLGNYELRYAAGERWYGTTHLFGPDTAFSEAKSNFRLSDEGDRYTGYTVELYLQVGGNLRTERIAPEDF